MAGSGYITVREFAAKVYAELGKKPKLLIAGKFMLRFMGIWNKQMKELVERSYLMTDPLFFGDSALQALLPNLRKTSYDIAIKETLKRMKLASTGAA